MVELAGEVGDQVAIGSVLAVIETEGADRAAEPVEDSKDERPLGDGAVEATPEMAEELPVTKVEEEARKPPNPFAPSAAEGRRASEERASTSLGTNGRFGRKASPLPPSAPARATSASTSAR